ncbi:fibroblast growth factor receptor-like 1 [Culex quinquefasciatus]|uniref:fibroblast growth factor receptor-like 1 n=1 Tax=Culex quinquefasciatus TaxID=7176 RepID=UPI0018E3F879|nr:fibroblast growth factor receptor-like 1 [Culex quinquefasciatus]
MITSCNWFVVLTTIAVLHCYLLTVVNSSRGSTPHSDNEILKLTQCPAGSEARLRCGIKDYHTDHMNASDVQWFFKPCGEGINRTSCHNRDQLDHIPWHPVDCEGKRCRVTLSIRNASEADSGLYRCSIHPYRTDNQTQLDIQLIRIFQLDVIKSILDESVAAPELLDNLPANTTALLESHVVLQCRVHSKVHPTIKWFRRLNVDNPLEDHNFNENKSIRYLENSYELVPSSGERLLSTDIYLSKLILYNVSGRDVGIYVCVGINYGGVNTADAYVSVVHANGSPVSTGTTSVVDLLVLFLIPLGLALIPLAVWVCFLVTRRRNARDKEVVSLPAYPRSTESMALERRTPVRSISNSTKGRHARNLSYEGSHVYEKINMI